MPAGVGNAIGVMDNGYMVTSLNNTLNTTRRLESMVPGTTTMPRVTDDAPGFVVTAEGIRTPFGIDDDAFDRWVAIEGDELGYKLYDLSDDCAGSVLSDLVYGALSAGALVGDPDIELNVHADGSGYLVRLNNVTGRQQLVGLTNGRHELRWPPYGLTLSEETRFYLQEVCDIANALLNNLLIAC
ncbi:hypothetical protein [Mycobacterium haemophilum]|nr:hypothetical protein [Mycobacterium haemophilum]MCV7342085.1 hypothetical protein [Mycobacterium haemophilum DSM 44634]